MPDFDTDEQAFHSQVTRGKACPSLPVLLAAQQGVLPEQAQLSVTQHIAECGLCTMLLQDLAELPEAAFTAEQEQRLRPVLPAIPFAANVVSLPAKRPSSLPMIAAIAAALVLTVTGLMAYRMWDKQQMAKQTPTAVPQRTPLAAPVEIALAKLPAPAGIAEGMVLRGDSAAASVNPPFAELLPAFEAYNQDQFDVAVHHFSALQTSYPKSDIPPLYLGIAKLFLGQNEQALDTLAHADAIAAAANKDAADWYYAVAAARVQSPKATAMFQSICHAGRSAYAIQACKVAAASPAGAQ